MSRRNQPAEGSDSTEEDTRADNAHAGPDNAFDENRQRERFGGINWGSGFFGWLVAVAVAVLLTSIVGAIAAAAESNQDVIRSVEDREAGTIGIVAAVVLLVVLMIAYYTGGYVAGRMSRFDGGKQGMAVWGIGLLVTILAVVLGVVFDAEYNILDRVDVPTVPIPTETLNWGYAITGAAVLVGTLLSAMTGGKVGRRYHSRVDNAAYPN